MPVSPRNLTRRAELYDQWATLLTAGIPVLRALTTLEKGAFGRRIRHVMARMAVHLEAGGTLAGALEAERHVLDPFDVTVLAMGERSGRLEVCLRDLAAHNRQRAQWTRQVLDGCAYPALVVTTGLVLFPVELIVSGIVETNWAPFLRHKAQILGVVAAGGAAVTILAASPLSHWIGAGVERIGSWIPVWGSARHELALARLARALDSLLNTGMGVIEAWPAAAEASGSSRLRRHVRRWQEPLASGALVSEAMAGSHLFPSLFRDSYRVAETAGSLDEALPRLRDHYAESAGRKMLALSVWIPRLIYFAVLLYAAGQVIGFWQGYWAQFDAF